MFKEYFIFTKHYDNILFPSNKSKKGKKENKRQDKFAVCFQYCLVILRT